MLKIKFRYKDRYTNGKWSYNTSYMDSVKECIEFFGLETDCEEYEILEVTEVK